MQLCGWNYPRVEVQGAKKEVCFVHKILVFHFFFFASGFAQCHLQCDQYDLNVKFLIFFKKNYKVYNVKILNQDPYRQK
jgi:hypothetical protein